MFDVALCAILPQALPGVLGKWTGALIWRDLTALDGWRGDLGCIKTLAHKRFINRVKWSVCQIDRREYMRKQDVSQTNILAGEYETMCDSNEGFSKVACKGEYCFKSTQWKNCIQNPNRKCQI